MHYSHSLFHLHLTSKTSTTWTFSFNTKHMCSLFKCVFEASENSKRILHLHARAHYVSSMFCEETSFDLPSAPKRQERAKKQLHLLYFSTTSFLMLPNAKKNHAHQWLIILWTCKVIIMNHRYVWIFLKHFEADERVHIERGKRRAWEFPQTPQQLYTPRHHVEHR